MPLLLCLLEVLENSQKTGEKRYRRYFMKLDLLTNATVVDDAIRFVSDRSKEKLKPSSCSSNEDNKKESNESDYDKNEDQLQ
jgi:hypothetical protein